MNSYTIRQIVDNETLDKLNELKVRCECGHTLIIPVYRDYNICTHCGKKVQNNTLLHFKFKLLKQMRKEDKNESGGKSSNA